MKEWFDYNNEEAYKIFIFCQKCQILCGIKILDEGKGEWRRVKYFC